MFHHILLFFRNMFPSPLWQSSGCLTIIHGTSKVLYLIHKGPTFLNSEAHKSRLIFHLVLIILKTTCPCTFCLSIATFSFLQILQLKILQPFDGLDYTNNILWRLRAVLELFTAFYDSFYSFSSNRIQLRPWFHRLLFRRHETRQYLLKNVRIFWWMCSSIK